MRFVSVAHPAHAFHLPKRKYLRYIFSKSLRLSLPLPPQRRWALCSFRIEHLALYNLFEIEKQKPQEERQKNDPQSHIQIPTNLFPFSLSTTTTTTTTRTNRWSIPFSLKWSGRRRLQHRFFVSPSRVTFLGSSIVVRVVWYKRLAGLWRRVFRRHVALSLAYYRLPLCEDATTCDRIDCCLKADQAPFRLADKVYVKNISWS